MNGWPSPAEARPGAATREATLDNGLKVLVREEHTAPLASVWCWYRVGSKDERPGLTGVSHWVEHMNFKGTTNIPRDQVKGIIEQFGGSWNGYTWIDQTTYLETATRDALDRMLFIESERMAHCLYDPEDCESERTVIISELQGGENDPDQLLDQELTATAFKAHPYRHPTIGWLSDLQTMTRDDLYGYYRRYYIPNNATLVIVGDVDTDDVLRKRRAALRRRSPPAPRPDADPHRRARADRRAARDDSQGRHGRVSASSAFTRPPSPIALFVPALLLDAVLTGAKGVNLWSSFRVAAAAAERASLSRAGRARASPRRSSGAMLPTEQPFLYTVSATATDGVPLARSRPRCSRNSIASAATASRRRTRRGPRRNCTRSSCSTTTASPTSRTSSATSRPSAAVDVFDALPARLRRVTLDEVARGRAPDADARRTGPSAGSIR